MVNNCAELQLHSGVGNMSLLDGSKEEKAVSCHEQQEDGCQLPQQGLYQQPCIEPFHENGGLSQDSEIDAQGGEELLDLQKRLDYLKKRRRRIQQSTMIECTKQEELLLKRLNSRRRERSEIVDEYLSAWKGRDTVSFFLECSKRWNVLNDCFPIWIDGKSAFATINGCRLGAQATPLPNDLLIAARGRSETKNNGKWVISGNNNTSNGYRENPASPAKRSILGLFGSTNDGSSHANSKNSDRGRSTISEPIKVPWMEVNAALGHACLLLKVLQESSLGGKRMKFTHELHPMGATSKIGIRFGPTGVLAAAAGILSNGGGNEIMDTPPVVYNLFFEEASGLSFFKKNDRNFNWALQAFLQCIAEAAAQQADKTIAIPHAIRHKKSSSINANANNSNNYLNGGEWTIGGLSICYPSPQQAAGAESKTGGRKTTTVASSAALEWTRACRFLLTDLKWLVAYAAKHIDR